MNKFAYTIKIEKNAFAEELLLQEGLPFVVDDLYKDNSTSSIWLIDDSSLVAKKISRIKSLLKTGYVVICDNKTAGVLKNSVHIISSDGGLRQDEGGVIALPYNYADYSGEAASGIKEFQSEEGVVKECVALKHRLLPREALARCIKEVFFAKGLPYVHTWYYPDGCRTIFSFKVDVDEYQEEKIRELLRRSAGHQDAMTWFVCCSVFEKDAVLLRNMAKDNFDVQSHGYFHHVYNTARENSANISRSIDFLIGNGAHPEGFAGPMGKWNRPLGEALGALGVKYSSEFGFDYDNLPSFPVFNDGPVSTLQIPSHPICAELFLEAGIYEKARGYFLKIIDAKYANNDPIILYGHPDKRLSQYGDIFSEIMDRASKLSNVRRMTFTDINDWCRRRRSFRFYPDANDKDKVRTDALSSDIWYRIEREGGNEGFVKSGACIGLKSIKCSPLRKKEKLYDEHPIGHTLKDELRNILDWEKVTPCEYIDRNNVAGTVKYFLRKINL